MSRPGTAARILVIDDEAAIRDSLRMILEYQGYAVMTAATGDEGVALVEREAPDLVFLDIKMPGMDGLEVLQRLTHLTDVTPIVVMSGHGTITTAVEATRLGAFDFLEKPLETERVLVLVRNAVDSRRLRTENRTLRKDQEKRHQIVGDSAGLGAVKGAILNTSEECRGRTAGRARKGAGRVSLRAALGPAEFTSNERVEVNSGNVRGAEGPSGRWRTRVRCGAAGV